MEGEVQGSSLRTSDVEPEEGERGGSWPKGGRSRLGESIKDSAYSRLDVHSLF